MAGLPLPAGQFLVSKVCHVAPPTFRRVRCHFARRATGRHGRRAGIAFLVLAGRTTSPFAPPRFTAKGRGWPPKSLRPRTPASEKLPTIVLSHGWGGVAAQLRGDAVAFARAGYLVLTFDYRGWGASDSRVILTGPAPARTKDLRFTAEVQEVREVVDPIDQTTDLANAVSWIYGEPQCDRDRIGLWGSSYSGGHVVYVAVRDPRVKATVSQVPAFDSRLRHAGRRGSQDLSRGVGPHARRAWAIRRRARASSATCAARRSARN